LEKLAMKKTLIALAVLTVSGASFAQSSVQIDGTFDAGFQSIDYKGNRVNGIANNGASTSGINFRGTEDLGGGLKASFRMETNMNTVNRDGNKSGGQGAFGNGEIRVGLAGGFGAIDAGAVNYNALGTALTGQPFGTNYGSGFGGTLASLVRADNSVKYTSPSFSGLNVTLYNAQKQTKADATYANGGATTSPFAFDVAGADEIGVNYANGPVAASFSNLKSKAVSGVNTTYNTLGANYAFGAAKLFALVQEKKLSDNTDKTSYASVSATYTMGATTLLAQFGELKDKAGTNNGLKSKLASVGASYALSKRTDVYARYESIDDKANAVAITGFSAVNGETTRTRTAVGIKHTF
jgi:predicted porin